MPVGEKGFTVPWAMWVDQETRYWLRADFTTIPEKSGTSSMLIERLEEGFRVRPERPHDYYAFSKPASSGPARHCELLPVVELIAPDTAAHLSSADNT
ncbi:hypothetical protein AB0C34_17090 [Nocardia sp. NPDC049220]|uniref:hypothetical protein n=1 Tax=Nocardia sp. NPDC049220 TaxID=3155273 RepID=UPI0033DCC860